MSWSYTVSGETKEATLAAFDKATDANTNCNPKDAVKAAALALAAHMAEGHVRSIRSNGHTNANGENCSICVAINC